jgi:uncharacterized protein YjbJ (UPF0337 family)
MITNKVTGYWVEKKGKLKQLLAKLTANDRMLNKGMREEMFGKLQIKLDVPKEELRKIIDIFNQPLY